MDENESAISLEINENIKKFIQLKHEHPKVVDNLKGFFINDIKIREKELNLLNSKQNQLQNETFNLKLEKDVYKLNNVTLKLYETCNEILMISKMKK
jgi:hypothetical protein